MSIAKCLENGFSPTRTVEIGFGKENSFLFLQYTLNLISPPLFFIGFLIFLYGIIVFVAFFNFEDLFAVKNNMDLVKEYLGVSVYELVKYNLKI